MRVEWLSKRVKEPTLMLSIVRVLYQVFAQGVLVLVPGYESVKSIRRWAGAGAGAGLSAGVGVAYSIGNRQ